MSPLSSVNPTSYFKGPFGQGVFVNPTVKFGGPFTLSACNTGLETDKFEKRFGHDAVNVHQKTKGIQDLANKIQEMTFQRWSP